jgi:hypothetical protein
MVCGVMLGPSSLALAQAEHPLSMFDLFEPQESGRPDLAPAEMPRDEAKKAAGKTVFDLFRPQRKPTAKVTRDAPVSVSPSREVAKAIPELSNPNEKLSSGEAERGTLAKEKQRLRSLAASLQHQVQAQVAQDRRLKAEAEKLSSEREGLVKERLELETLKKSLASAPTSAAPSKHADSFNADSGRQSIPIPQEPEFKRSKETHQTRIALAEPSPPPATKGEDPSLKSSRCEKAKAVIEGYAFVDVQAKNCTGDSYSFSAIRDKNSFSIRIDPQTWELIEVSKAMPEALGSIPPPTQSDQRRP